jgi:hypothetical protein
MNIEILELEGIDKLLPSIEQAKLLHVLKEPEQLTAESKKYLTNRGIFIGSLLTLTFIIGMMIYYKNQEKKAKED